MYYISPLISSHHLLSSYHPPPPLPRPPPPTPPHFPNHQQSLPNTAKDKPSRESINHSHLKILLVFSLLEHHDPLQKFIQYATKTSLHTAQLPKAEESENQSQGIRKGF